jgi:hypothetical protein
LSAPPAKPAHAERLLVVGPRCRDGVDQDAKFVGGAQQDVDFDSEVVGDARLDLLRELGTAALLGGEEDVAGVDVGPHVVEAQPLARGCCDEAGSTSPASRRSRCAG